MKKLLILLLAVAGTAANSQNLITDTLFGNNGQISALPVGVTTTSRILRQPDNKIIHCGYNYDFNCNCYYNDMVRLDACGNLDSTFGINGSVNHTFDHQNTGEYYELQPDGKILAAGVQASGNGGSQQFPFIARYNSDGTVDSTFGTNGTNKISNVGTGNFTGIFLMDSGKILCTGNPFSGSNLIMRFDSTGAVDNTFGTNGAVQHSTPPGVNHFYDFKSAMRSDGKIISVAPAWLGVNNDKNVVLSCFDTLGVIDTTFGTNGYFIDYNFVIGIGLRMILQSDDKVIVAQHNIAETAIIIARYNTNGTLDTTYGVNGHINIPAPNGPSRLQFLTKFNDDKILIGYQENGVIPVFKKFDTNGVQDNNFSFNGGTTFEFSNLDKARAALVSASDELLIGGGGNTFSMIRFVLNSTVTHITQNGFTLNANVSGAGVTYQWYLNGTPISAATDSIYTATQPGTYLVEVASIWGCISSDLIILTNTGISSTTSFDAVSIYPNPVNEILTIAQQTSAIPIEYFIADAVGKIVVTGTTTGEKTTVDMHSLLSGIYFLKTTSLQGHGIIKVVKN